MEMTPLVASFKKNDKNISPLFFLIGIFMVSFLVFILIELFRDQLYFVVSASNYLLFHNIVEVFSIITSISIFSVGLLTNRQSRDERIIFLSYAFLGIGLLDLMHVLSFPGMPTFITPSSTNKGILFWISARLFSACAFVISAIVFKNPIRFKYWKQCVFAAVILSVMAVFSGVIFYEHSIPAMFVEGTGLTPLKIYFEYITIGLFVLSYIAYLRHFLKTKKRIFLLYLAAITISIFSELAFTLYKSAYDTFNLLGHLYKFIAFCFIYAGIFSVSIKNPYKKLLESTTELKNDIIVRKKAEEALKESTIRLNEAQHIAHIGSWELDLAKNILTWSNEIYKIFEIDQKKFNATYEAFLSAIHPEDRKMVDFAYTDSLKTKKPYTIDHRLLFPDDRIKYVHEECKTFYDKLGKPLRSIGTVQDITERKNAEESLRKNEEELNKAQLLGKIGNWDWDIATDTIAWSEEYYHIFNFDPTQHPPKYEEHLKVYTPESAVRLDEAVKKNMQTGEPYELDLEIANPKGPTRWITARSETKRDALGKIIGLRGTAQDITERKNAEMELSRANRALKILSETNQILIHITTEADLLDKFCQIAVKIGNYHLAWIGFTEHDESKTIRPVAQAGFEENNIKSLNLTWSDTEYIPNPIGAAIRTGYPVIAKNIAQNLTMVPLRDDAIKRGYQSFIALPLVSQDQAFGVVSIYSKESDAFSNKEVDILKEIADDLAFGIATLRMRSKVEKRTKEVDQLKNKFIQIVSHQLRTPLTNIRWQLERLLGGKHDHLNAIQEELVQSSYNENLKIVSRINDLVTALDI